VAAILIDGKAASTLLGGYGLNCGFLLAYLVAFSLPALKATFLIFLHSHVEAEAFVALLTDELMHRRIKTFYMIGAHIVLSARYPARPFFLALKK
jgi:hypothetical protein